MKYSQIDIEAVEQAADIREIVPDLKGRGASMYCKCPQCGKEGKGKGLVVTHKKEKGRYVNVAKCFACGFSYGSAIKAYQAVNSVGYIEAVEALAKDYRVNLVSIEEKRGRLVSNATAGFGGSFCEMQLFASGLTFDDILVKVPIKGTNDFKFESPFRKGGADNAVVHLNESDDEMLIFYYDLDGNPMKFTPKNRPNTSQRVLARVRWSNPDIHKDATGKPIKYQSMKGAPAAFYIPQRIRDMYRNSEPIETLVIQEGEKKAEKACKEGIPSIGIQGIFNIGSKEDGIPKELQYIVSKCAVRNVVLLFDSDWDHLHRDIKPGDSIDQRPNQFSRAVIKFQQFVRTLHNLNLSVDLWFGHVKENERGDKGIDDLLVGELHMKESLLAEDFKATINSHNGLGQYVNLYKITSRSEYDIRDYWKLNSRVDFFAKYHDRIKDLTRFRFGRITFVSEDGKFREAARNSEQDFWKVTENEKGNRSVEFDYVGAFDFLEANKFHKVHTVDLRNGEYKYVKIDDFVMSEVSDTEIREFVMQYVRQSTKDRDVLNMFLSRLGSLLGSDKLERLENVDDPATLPVPLSQTFHYKGCRVDVSTEGMAAGEMSENVWDEAVIKRPFRRVPIFKSLGKDEQGFFFELTPEGMKCEYMQFLMCTSNFWKGHEDSMTQEDLYTFAHHIVNKITSIGYLLNSWKPRSEQIAIIAMDAKMDEVGASNGRSGKSLIGVALSKFINTQYVDAKKISNNDDFIYSLVTPKTRIVFIDDVRVNFDFESFYSALTGDLQVNPKQGARFEIKYEMSPKFYITTNHSINDQSDSGKDRRVLMAFSNYFKTGYSPFEYFGHNLFDDWDEEQWCLFDNLMIECVMYYLRSYSLGWNCPGRGVVHPPMQQLDKRALRQLMGEAFLQWADAFLDPDNHVLNYKYSRKEFFNKYHDEYPNARDQIRSTDFGRRMKAFCRYKGYHFCPNARNEEGDRFSDWIQSHPGESFMGVAPKSNGVEYWTISTDEFAKVQPW